MRRWPQVCYTYDGTFNGFLTCVYESFVNKESPAHFSAPGDVQVSLYPERPVETHPAHAKRVRASLPKRLSPDGSLLATHAFLTCLPEREKHIYDFISLGYEWGPGVIQDLTNDRVLVLNRAVWHLRAEAHLLKGFIRFSEQDGVLAAEIEPKNRVLPLLRPHFCTRYPNERFLIYDRVHREGLFHQSGQWALVPLEALHLDAPDSVERGYRAMWRRFYDTIAIEGRYNPKCRMTHMPKRYWNTMTEFQEDPPEEGKELPQ